MKKISYLIIFLSTIAYAQQEVTIKIHSGDSNNASATQIGNKQTSRIEIDSSNKNEVHSVQSSYDSLNKDKREEKSLRSKILENSTLIEKIALAGTAVLGLFFAFKKFRKK